MISGRLSTCCHIAMFLSAFNIFLLNGNIIFIFIISFYIYTIQEVKMLQNRLWYKSEKFIGLDFSCSLSFERYTISGGVWKMY